MKKHLNTKSGFYRFNNRVEINWSVYEWALPFSIEFSEYLMLVRVLCISLIIPRK